MRKEGRVFARRVVCKKGCLPGGSGSRRQAEDKFRPEVAESRGGSGHTASRGAESS